MNLYKKFIFKLMLCVCFFFLLTSNVMAFEKKKNTNNVFFDCNPSTGCIPLCAYGDKAMIGIFYKGNDAGGYAWEVAFVSRDDIRYSKLATRLPHKDIYSGGDSLVEVGYYWNKNKNGANEMFENLSNNFACPSYYFEDLDNLLGSSSKAYDEICFSNRSNDCSIHNDMQTHFNESTPITYNFSVEYGDVMTKAYQQLRDMFADTSNENNMQKIKFLKSFDNGYSFDPSLSADDNAKNNCEYLKSKADGKYEEYINSFNSVTFQRKYIDEYINPKLSHYAASSNVRDTGIYNYETLYKLMDGRKVGIYNAGESTVEKSDGTIIEMFFPNAFNKNVKDAINFIDAYCNDIANVSIDTRVDSDGDGVLDTDSMNAKIDTAKESFKLDPRIFSDPVIDWSETYDCSFLSGIAGIISDAYFILEMAGLAILVVLSIFDYVKVFMSDNADELNKSNSKFVKRLIIAVLLFLLPAFVNLALGIFNIEGINSDNPLCVKISNK